MANLYRLSRVGASRKCVQSVSCPVGCVRGSGGVCPKCVPSPHGSPLTNPFGTTFPPLVSPFRPPLSALKMRVSPVQVRLSPFQKTALTIPPVRFFFDASRRSLTAPRAMNSGGWRHLHRHRTDSSGHFLHVLTAVERADAEEPLAHAPEPAAGRDDDVHLVEHAIEHGP